MNTPTLWSECSSRGESGWTTYLEQASNSTDPYTRKQGEMGSAQVVNRVDQEDDDEDLSMVSDATSGPPPNFDVNNTVDTMYYYSCGPSFGSEEDKKSKQKLSKGKKVKKCLLCLDDTASSSIFHNSSEEKYEAPSEDHEPHELLSADAHVQGELGAENNSGFLQRDVIRGKSGCSLGRKRP